MAPTAMQQPFWKDEPDFQQMLTSSAGFLRPFQIVFLLLSLVSASAVIFYVIFKLSPLLAWGWLFYSTLVIGRYIYQRFRKKTLILNSEQIQENARKLTSAAVMGSAIHVAGHPLLEREQPVVLALTSEGIKIFSYDDPPNRYDRYRPNRCHSHGGL